MLKSALVYDQISNNPRSNLKLHEGRHSGTVVGPALRVKVAGRKAEVCSRSESLKVVEHLVFSLLYVSHSLFNFSTGLDRCGRIVFVRNDS